MKHQTTSTTSKRVATCLFGLLLSGLTTHAFGQANSPAVHPIPSAPKRHYEPASFFAQPDLQCKVYPAGSAGSPSQTITVFTNDDGYARFHAVRANTSGDVQRLAADCTDSAGMSHSYPVDLTSDDTFRPRPLDISKERGIDRSALEGDPLSYTQEELLHAGYGLRPDPKNTGAYARWLSAATVPMRMLTATRPYPRPTDPWWVGSTLNGAPKYVGAEATFEVPTPIPSGDETSGGTIIAIWTGVDGGDEALIQAGVNVQTTASTAVFWSWREFCCGDGISNSYSSAFTPNAGDKIYSDSWYCDSVGRLNVNGGYGYSYLADLTSGLVLSCIKAEGSLQPVRPRASIVGATARNVSAEQHGERTHNEDSQVQGEVRAEPRLVN
jgi:hypothetical protein